MLFYHCKNQALDFNVLTVSIFYLLAVLYFHILTKLKEMIIIIIQWVNYSVFRLFLFFVFVFLRSFFVFVNQIWVGGFPPIVFLILFLFFFIFKNKSENEIKIGKDRSCFPRVHSFLLSSSFFSLFCFSFPFVFVIPSIHISKSNTRVSNNAFNKLRCYFRNPKYKITSIDSIARYQENFVSHPYTTNKTIVTKKEKQKGTD